MDLLLSIPFLAQFITKEDKNVLKFLTNISLERFIDSDDFLIEFFFQENPYFENETLRIKFTIDESNEFE